MPPPGSKIARSALSGWKLRGRHSNSELKAALHSAWCEVSSPVVQADCTAITARTSQQTPCFLAGFCLCNERGTFSRACVVAWAQGLRKGLQKGTEARKYFNRSTLLMYVFSGPSHTGPVCECSSGLWFHVSYGNLQNGRFSCLPLECNRIGPLADIGRCRSMLHLNVPARRYWCKCAELVGHCTCSFRLHEGMAHALLSCVLRR
jgi:hypothetical protein